MSDTQKHLTKTTFASLNIDHQIIKGVNQAGYELCTPIQEKSLPISLTGQDIMAQAQTGTGKTLAFLIATFQYLLQHPKASKDDKQPRALILAPSRELAIQIHKDAEAIGKDLFSITAIYGGTDYEKQRKSIENGTDIIIGTPGRVIDYSKQGVFKLKNIQVMVLDEADRMFDLGFIKDIRFVLRRLAPIDQRLSMLFSATLSYRVTELAYEHMNLPQLVEIEPEVVTTENVVQKAYYVANEDKIPLLVKLLKEEAVERSIVFVNTKHEAEKVASFLVGNDIQAGILSGDVPQKKRQRLVTDFQKGEFPVLVATDVAARGIHVPDVSHVFNYDLPNEADDYVHRIGRTGRAGKTGIAISLACENTAFYLPDIEELIQKKLEKCHYDPMDLPKLKPRARLNMERVKPFAKNAKGDGKRPQNARRNQSRNKKPVSQG